MEEWATKHSLQEVQAVIVQCVRACGQCEEVKHCPYILRRAALLDGGKRKDRGRPRSRRPQIDCSPRSSGVREDDETLVLEQAAARQPTATHHRMRAGRQRALFACQTGGLCCSGRATAAQGLWDRSGAWPQGRESDRRQDKRWSWCRKRRPGSSLFAIYAGTPARPGAALHCALLWCCCCCSPGLDSVAVGWWSGASSQPACHTIE